MKQQNLPGIFFLSLILVLGSCDQEPLFWDIAHEYPPIEPAIKGAPGPVVELTTPNHILYVSNGDVWRYDFGIPDSYGKPRWERMSLQPGGNVKTLAAASDGSADRLFSLDRNGNIKQLDGSVWTTLSVPWGAGRAEHIFGAGDWLFAGVLTGTSGEPNGYAIYSIKVSSPAPAPVTLIKSSTGLLRGAAFAGGNYYLGTQGDGVYKTSTPGGALTSGDKEAGYESLIQGLLSDGTDVYAAGSSAIYKNGASVGSGYTFSGAMAIWNEPAPGSGKLLLLGLRRSSGSFGYGYRELNLSSFVFQTPGAASPSSVKIGDQYISAIGEHAVNYLFVADLSTLAPPFYADGEDRPVVFASTAGNGLWSYRRRSGGEPQWNGEDNGP